MVYHQSLGFSSCELSGAIARAMLYDLKVNLFDFDSFPQVDVKRGRDGFDVTLRLNGLSNSFQLSIDEAKRAVQRLREKDDHSLEILKRVQDSLAALGGTAIELRYNS